MAKKLQNFRKEANLSREALAAATRVSYNTICRAEQQIGSMSFGTAIKLAEFFADELDYSYEHILKRLSTSYSKPVTTTAAKRKQVKKKTLSKKATKK